MASGDRLTVGGFLGRFAFALLVMSATDDSTAAQTLDMDAQVPRLSPIPEERSGP